MSTHTYQYRLSQDKANEIRKNPPAVMTLLEAAEYMTCSPRKLRDLIHQNKVKSTNIGSRIIIRREWLETFLGN
jgi:excisionase family DNA binding protein